MMNQDNAPPGRSEAAATGYERGKSIRWLLGLTGGVAAAGASVAGLMWLTKPASPSEVETVPVTQAAPAIEPPDTSEPAPPAPPAPAAPPAPPADRGFLAPPSHAGSAQAAPVRKKDPRGLPREQASGGNAAPAPVAAVARPIVKAWKLDNASLTIPEGLGECTLVTAIDTTMAAPVLCQLAAPVRSADGRVDLLDAGVMVKGRVATAMRDGQRVVGVIVTGIRSVQVNADFEAAALDAMGRAGLDAKVDRHADDRFFAAILAALAGNVTTVLGGGGASVVVPAMGAGGRVGADVVRESVAREPTGYVMPGARVAFVFPAPIDLSAVYEVREVAR